MIDLRKQKFLYRKNKFLVCINFGKKKVSIRTCSIIEGKDELMNYGFWGREKIKGCPDPEDISLLNFSAY
ncbi:MAG: hypothetical protein JXB49_12675 [Bacteroidales bacterium]|nr:hypothetical protein [Bacteroidales bacterium]